MVTKKTQLSSQIWLIGLFCLSFPFIAGCEPIKTSAPVTSGTLPPPIVQITHAAPTTIINTPIPPTAVVETPLESDVSKLADNLFADRLIERISIPAIHVESAVTPVGWRINFSTDFQNGQFEWDSPGPDVGWVITSALPDETGNILVYGHNNMYEQVFKDLGNLLHGDKIYLQTADRRWEYEVRQIFKLPVIGASEKQLEDYQKYLQPTQDERITLISCWPPISNTHRVVVIARRVSSP